MHFNYGSDTFAANFPLGMPTGATEARGQFACCDTGTAKLQHHLFPDKELLCPAPAPLSTGSMEKIPGKNQKGKKLAEFSIEVIRKSGI